MTIVEQLARFLASKLSLEFEGTTPGSVFFGYLPESPVKSLGVYANDLRTPGDDDGTRIQIAIRSNLDGAWPLNMGIEIMRLLDDARDLIFIPKGAYISRVEVEKGFEFMGFVGDNSQMYTANFVVYYCG